MAGEVSKTNHILDEVIEWILKGFGFALLFLVLAGGFFLIKALIEAGVAFVGATL